MSANHTHLNDPIPTRKPASSQNVSLMSRLLQQISDLINQHTTLINQHTELFNQYTPRTLFDQYALELGSKEDLSNKVDVLDASDDHYPTSQAVKTQVDSIVSTINAIQHLLENYVISASISGNTLTLTVKSDNETETVTFEGGSLSWGNINGTITSQTDLANILTELADVKVDKVIGKGLSTNDYTTVEKEKLASLNVNAEENVQSDWSQSDNTKDDFIKNKPSIPTKTSDLTNDSDFADKSFVNSSIATSTATFLGTYNQVSDLGLSYVAEREVEDTLVTFLAGHNPNENDYCFIEVPTSNTSGAPIDHVDKYKYSDGEWLFEYKLNNSGYTDAQWQAINSGATANKVGSYDSHLLNTSNPHGVTATQLGLGSVDNTSDATKKTNFTGSIASANAGFVTGGDVYTALSDKQDSITDGSATIASVSSDIVTLKSGVTQSSGAISNSSGSDITLSKVAKTGSYSDLSNKPTIQSVSVSSTGTSTDEVEYITIDGTEKKLAGGTKVTFVDWS